MEYRRRETSKMRCAKCGGMMLPHDPEETLFYCIDCQTEVTRQMIIDYYENQAKDRETGTPQKAL
jgi:DNA-directed RNA polymerase subunit M/transcription elongation factor TFIIS